MARTQYARPAIKATKPQDVNAPSARDAALLAMGINPSTLPAAKLPAPSAPAVDETPPAPAIDREAAAAALGIDVTTLPVNLSTSSAADDIPIMNRAVALKRNVIEAAAGRLNDDEIDELLLMMPRQGKRNREGLRTMLVCAVFLLKNERATWTLLPSALTEGEVAYALRNRFERMARMPRLPEIGRAIALSRIWRPERKAEFAALMYWVEQMRSRWDVARRKKLLRATDAI